MVLRTLDPLRRDLVWDVGPSGSEAAAVDEEEDWKPLCMTVISAALEEFRCSDTQRQTVLADGRGRAINTLHVEFEDFLVEGVREDSAEILHAARWE